MDKAPHAAFRDPQFARAAHQLTGSTFVAHIRYASTGALTTANTHPFAQDGWLFAHNGVLGGLEILDAELHRRGVANLVAGDSDSERFFALLVSELRRIGTDPSAQRVGDAVRAAMAWCGQHVPIFALNVVLARAGAIWAVRWPQTHPLWFLPGVERDDPAASPRLRSASLGVSGVAARAPETVVVASERMTDDAAWHLIPSGHVLIADGDRPARLADLELPEPAHRITLEQLGAAAASQAH